MRPDDEKSKDLSDEAKARQDFRFASLKPLTRSLSSSSTITLKASEDAAGSEKPSAPSLRLSRMLGQRKQTPETASVPATPRPDAFETPSFSFSPSAFTSAFDGGTSSLRSNELLQRVPSPPLDATLHGSTLTLAASGPELPQRTARERLERFHFAQSRPISFGPIESGRSQSPFSTNLKDEQPDDPARNGSSWREQVPIPKPNRRQTEQYESHVASEGLLPRRVSPASLLRASPQHADAAATTVASSRSIPSSRNVASAAIGLNSMQGQKRSRWLHDVEILDDAVSIDSEARIASKKLRLEEEEDIYAHQLRSPANTAALVPSRRRANSSSSVPPSRAGTSDGTAAVIKDIMHKAQESFMSAQHRDADYKRLRRENSELKSRLNKYKSDVIKFREKAEQSVNSAHEVMKAWDLHRERYNAALEAQEDERLTVKQLRKELKRLTADSGNLSETIASIRAKYSSRVEVAEGQIKTMTMLSEQHKRKADEAQYELLESKDTIKSIQEDLRQDRAKLTDFEDRAAQIKREKDDLTCELERTRKLAEAAQSRIAELEACVDKTRGILKECEKKNSEAERALTEKQAQADEIQRQLLNAQKESADMKDELEGLRRELDTCAKTASADQEHMRKLCEEKSQLEAGRIKASKDMAAITAELAGIKLQQVEQARREQEAYQKSAQIEKDLCEEINRQRQQAAERQATIKTLEEAVQRLSREKSELQKVSTDSVDANTKVSQLQAEMDMVKKQLAERQKETKAALKNLESVRSAFEERERTTLERYRVNKLTKQEQQLCQMVAERYQGVLDTERGRLDNQILQLERKNASLQEELDKVKAKTQPVAKEAGATFNQNCKQAAPARARSGKAEDRGANGAKRQAKSKPSGTAPRRKTRSMSKASNIASQNEPPQSDTISGLDVASIASGSTDQSSSKARDEESSNLSDDDEEERSNANKSEGSSRGVHAEQRALSSVQAQGRTSFGDLGQSSASKGSRPRLKRH